MANPTGKGGFQERKHQINRKGRPKSFDALRTLAQQIAHEVAKDKSGQELVISGNKVTIVEAIMRQWATDKKMQQAFIEYAFGKVVQPVQHDLSTELLALIREGKLTPQEAAVLFPDATLPVAGIEA